MLAAEPRAGSQQQHWSSHQGRKRGANRLHRKLLALQLPGLALPRPWGSSAVQSRIISSGLGTL